MLLFFLGFAASAIDVSLLDSMERHNAYLPLKPTATSWHLAAAGGESESVQALLRSDTNTTVTIDLTMAGIGMLNAKPSPTNTVSTAVTVQRLGFIWASNATVGGDRLWPIACPVETLAAMGGCWVADPIMALDKVVLVSTTSSHTTAAAAAAAAAAVRPATEDTTVAGAGAGAGAGANGTLPTVADLVGAAVVSTATTVFIPAGLTVSLWITLAAASEPRDSGTHGAVTININGVPRVNITTHIREFILPTSSKLRNTVELSIAHLHRCFPLDSEQATNIRYNEYAEFMLRKLRLNPGSIYDSWRGPSTPCDFNDYFNCFNQSVAQLSKWVHEDGLNAFTVPAAPFAVTAAFVRQLRTYNISHLANFYGFDEYNGNMSAIREAFAPLKAAFPEVTTLTTAHIGTQYGSLVQHPLPFTSASLETLAVDAVTPQTNYLPPAANMSEVRRGGRQVWTYISMQPYKSGARVCRQQFALDGAIPLGCPLSYRFTMYIEPKH
jgi:hypothetical protein